MTFFSIISLIAFIIIIILGILLMINYVNKEFIFIIIIFLLFIIYIITNSLFNTIYIILISNLIGILISFFLPNTIKWLNVTKNFFYIWSIYIFLTSLTLFNELKFIDNHYIFLKIQWSNFFNLNYTILIDFTSIYFILLTTFLIPICLIISKNNINIKFFKNFILILFLIEFMLINVFITNDLLFFYIWFEAILIPMFILIGLFGSRKRKIHASFMFWFYTLIGSILMLIAILIIYYDFSTTFIQPISLLLNYEITKKNLLFFCFFISVMVKTPMFPFHIWLPEAHVEAPTAGSVLLAGILLKLGTYGTIRFIMPLFEESINYYKPFIMTLALISIIYSSLSTIRQIDLKKIIAYSSIAHMNVVILGLFSLTNSGFNSSIFLMLAHGIVSSALFICIGCLYDRYKTRNIYYYSGITTYMPIFSIFFLIFTLANSGFPLFCNFIGELTCLISCYKYNFFTAFIGSISMILGAIYSFWLFNRLCFRKFNINNNKYILKLSDISFKETTTLFILMFLALLFGIMPNLIFSNMFIFFETMIDTNTNAKIIENFFFDNQELLMYQINSPLDYMWCSHLKPHNIKGYYIEMTYHLSSIYELRVRGIPELRHPAWTELKVREDLTVEVWDSYLSRVYSKLWSHSFEWEVDDYDEHEDDPWEDHEFVFIDPDSYYDVMTVKDYATDFSMWSTFILQSQIYYDVSDHIKYGQRWDLLKGIVEQRRLALDQDFKNHGGEENVRAWLQGDKHSFTGTKYEIKYQTWPNFWDSGQPTTYIADSKKKVFVDNWSWSVTNQRDYLSIPTYNSLVKIVPELDNYYINRYIYEFVSEKIIDRALSDVIALNPHIVEAEYYPWSFIDLYRNWPYRQMSIEDGTILDLNWSDYKYKHWRVDALQDNLSNSWIYENEERHANWMIWSRQNINECESNIEFYRHNKFKCEKAGQLMHSLYQDHKTFWRPFYILKEVLGY